MQPFKYVLLGHTAMKLRGNEYYRIGGCWSVGFKIIDGKIFSKSNIKRLNNIELIETTKQIHDLDNQGYI